MAKRVAVECSHAASLAVKLANVDVVAAYPITPQTHIVERISEYVADGELNAEYINVESEHSAISACTGASAAGARCFTATAGQGLALMHEILFIAAGYRLPIVMTVANRALSPNLNIWGDQSDMMASRDCGWIQLFAENAQEIFDFTIQAFKLAEDHRVLLPVMVCIDGFILSHNVERVEMLPDEAVREFLGVREPVLPLDPDNPITMGPLALTDYYFEIKEGQDRAMYNVPEVFKEVEEAFKKMTGRAYGMYETYRTEDAEIIILTHSTPGGTAKVVADVLREQGEKVGVVRLRMFRPFPVDEIVKEVKHAKAVAVFEKCRSFGATCNPLAMEIRAALYDLDERPMVTDFVVGLGGRDVPPTTIVEGYNKTKEYLAKGKAPLYETLGVRK